MAFVADRPEPGLCSLLTARIDGAEKALELTAPFWFEPRDPRFEYDLGPDGGGAVFLTSHERGVELVLARTASAVPIHAERR